MDLLATRHEMELLTYTALFYTGAIDPCL